MPHSEDLDQIVDEIASRAARNVTLDDVFGHVLASNTSLPTTDRARIDAVMMKIVPEDVREWEAETGAASSQRPFVQPGRPERGFLDRLCVPLLFRGVRVGYIWILARDKHDDLDALREDFVADQHSIDRLGERVAAALAGDDAAHQRKTKSLRGALLGKSEIDAAVFDSVAQGSPIYLLVAVLPPFAEDGAANVLLASHAAADALRALHTEAFVHAEPDHVVFGLPSSASSAELIEQLQVSTRRRVGSLELGVPMSVSTCGSSELLSTPSRVSIAYGEAVTALQAATVDESVPGSTFSEAGVYKYFGAVAPAAADTRLKRLLDSAGGHAHVALLERVYDSDDSMQALADELHMHRTSLYNHLQRIARILGADPLLARVQQELHLAIKLDRWQRRPRFALHDAWERVHRR